MNLIVESSILEYQCVAESAMNLNFAPTHLDLLIKKIM